MKKLIIEHIKEQFEKEKYKLLSEKYVNSHQKLNYICPEGHEHSITWYNWYLGKRCPYCARNGKPTMEFIKLEFKKENYILLTKNYVNAHQKLKYKCSRGHIHDISWNNWKAGKRCPYCLKLGKPTIEFIRSEFAKERYKLLTTKYKNNRQKLDYICPKGHRYNISWLSWQLGRRCNICAYIKLSGDGNSQWKGGISFDPYPPEFNNKLKKSILERDNHQCQNPDCWGTGSKLTGHHIDYDKKNCDSSNIITICDSCNPRANKDRDYWTKFYQEIMNKKYGYTYERTIGKSV